MLPSLFSFFRGTALLFYRDMAGEDAWMPTVLTLGDVHPGNFGAMPNADNVPIFGVNDFDEAYCAPFTWDLKRGAVGFVLAVEDIGGYGPKRQRKVARRRERAPFRGDVDLDDLDKKGWKGTPASAVARELRSRCGGEPEVEDVADRGTGRALLADAVLRAGPDLLVQTVDVDDVPDVRIRPLAARFEPFVPVLASPSGLLAIYADSGGVPAGQPGDGNEFWSISLAPSDPQIQLGVTDPEDVVLTLTTPVPELPAGTWWIVFQVSLEFGLYGQYGISSTSDAAIGSAAMQINPGGGFGQGSDWWVNTSGSDLMFRLEGDVVPVELQSFVIE